jgi:hypothetical protein
MISIGGAVVPLDADICSSYSASGLPPNVSCHVSVPGPLAAWCRVDATPTKIRAALRVLSGADTISAVPLTKK